MIILTNCDLGKLNCRSPSLTFGFIQISQRSIELNLSVAEIECTSFEV